MGYVYKITNTVNNKSYIGISIHEPEKNRIREHLAGRGNRIIAKAVKKYGKDVFTYEILEENVFEEFLPDLEVAYIANHNTVTPNGYNLDTGGGGSGRPSENARKKMSEAKKGKKLSTKHRLKISEANKGKKHSVEHRRRLSEGKTGESNPFYGKKLSTEHCRKISEKLKGRNFMTEHCQKISEAKKGKTPSAETRQKISKTLRHPCYNLAYSYYSSLPSGISARQINQLMYNKFPSINKRTIRGWIRKWIRKPR